MTNRIRFAAALLVIGLAAICASAQAPTLRIQTDDPNLPSDLYYGNVKVKPLRLRPGTNQPVTIDDNDFMVQQQYIDFLNRMPDPPGFNSWVAGLNTCPAGDTTCDRIHVSEQFVRSAEFQQRGYFTFRFYPVSFPGQAGSDPPGFGHKPSFAEFLPDLRSVSRSRCFVPQLACRYRCEPGRLSGHGQWFLQFDRVSFAVLNRIKNRAQSTGQPKRLAFDFWNQA